MKNWLRAQPVQPTSSNELQTLIDRFVEEYNLKRPGFGGGSEPTRGWSRASTEEVSE